MFILIVSLCFSLAFFGLPLFHFLFVSLSLYLSRSFFLPSCHYFFAFFWFLVFCLFLSFSDFFAFMKRTTSKYPIRSHFGSSRVLCCGCALPCVVRYMPHCRSASAWEKRQARAVARGYIRSCPPGRNFISVCAAIRPEACEIIRSLEVHWKHDCLLSVPHHHARYATLSAWNKERISDGEARSALKLHRRAGKAKHGISRHSLSLQTDAEVTAYFRLDEADSNADAGRFL